VSISFSIQHVVMIKIRPVAAAPLPVVCFNSARKKESFAYVKKMYPVNLLALVCLSAIAASTSAVWPMSRRCEIMPLEQTKQFSNSLLKLISDLNADNPVGVILGKS
jgi:hypothetical protein